MFEPLVLTPLPEGSCVQSPTSEAFSMNYSLALFAGFALTITTLGVMNGYDIIDVAVGPAIQIHLEKISPQQSLPIEKAPLRD